MINPFYSFEEKIWTELCDVNRIKLAEWDEERKKCTFNPSVASMPHVLEVDPSKNLENFQLKETIEEGNELFASLCNSCAFIYTDPLGRVKSIFGTDEIKNNFHSINIRPGTSFQFAHAGLNAISMAMDLQKMVVVRGSEHDMELFEPWTCICTPLFLGDEVQGYLDLSFSCDSNLHLVAMLFNIIVLDIEKKMALRHPEIQKNRLYNLFEQYKMTKREKEVGYQWFQGDSALKIAHCLGIAEGTVRLMIKKIYEKTKVRDRGQFINLLSK